MADLPSFGVDDVSPNSSAIVGVTLVGDLEDALAVIRTAFLVARSLRTTLLLDLPGEDMAPVYLGEAPSAAGLMDSVRPRLRKLMSAHKQALVLEVTINVASFISEGSITMRIRSASAGSGKTAT
jgi:hypothetical protein